MASYACPCGTTQSSTDDPAGPLDTDGGLARCHECGDRVAIVPSP